MVAPEVRAPALLRLVGEAKARERKRDLHLIAALGHAALRVPDRVEADVLRLAPLRHAQVALNAERVDEELIAGGEIAIRIEHDAEVVVAEDVVALAKRRADLRGVVVGDEGDVEVLVVVRDPRFRLDRRCDLVARPDLAEVAELRRLRPGRVIELAVDLDLARDARHGGGRLPLRLEVASLGGRIGGRRASYDREHENPGQRPPRRVAPNSNEAVHCSSQRWIPRAPCAAAFTNASIRSCSRGRSAA